jgi:hypothetical protein
MGCETNQVPALECAEGTFPPSEIRDAVIDGTVANTEDMVAGLLAEDAQVPEEMEA